jgi:phage shock protein PspC (stress-responsive transcriptional regulator)
MTTTPPEAPSDAAEPPPEHTGGPRVTREDAKDLGRIRRSLTDRKIAGVAGGIARHLDIDPLLVRVGLVLLAFFGGGGLLIYAAGWLLIPEEGSNEGVIRTDDRTRTVLLAVAGVIAGLSLVGDSFGGWEFPWPLAIVGLVIAAVAAASRPKQHPGPLPAEGWISAGMRGEVPGQVAGNQSTYSGYEPGPRPFPSDRRRRGPLLFWSTMGLALVAVAVVATFDLAGWDAPVSAYPAAVLAVCGVMLLVGAFFGRAGGLIFVGLLAALATLATTAIQDVDVDQFAGQIDTTPQTADEVKDRYALGAGEIVLDLRELSPTELQALDDRTIELDVRLGHIRVLVPEDGLDVLADSDFAGAGESVLFDNRTDGSDRQSHGNGDADPDLTLDLDMLFGQIEVLTEEPGK